MGARAKTPGYRALACIEAVRPVQLMLGNGSGADRPNSHCDQMMMRRRRYFTSVNQSSGPDGTRKGSPRRREGAPEADPLPEMDQGPQEQAGLYRDRKYAREKKG
jgi:hypothetical protein